MTQVGTRVNPAGLAGALRVQRPEVPRVALQAKIHRTARRQRLPVAGVARGQHAVEHVDSPRHALHEVLRSPHAHEIAGTFAGQALQRRRQHLPSELLVLAEGENKELVEFSSWPQCLKLIDYYCEHDEEREKIARAGREKVLAEHTYDRRIEQIFEVCRKEWGI